MFFLVFSFVNDIIRTGEWTPITLTERMRIHGTGKTSYVKTQGADAH